MRIALATAVALLLVFASLAPVQAQDKNAMGSAGPVKFSGLMFGDLFYNADMHTASLRDINGWQFRRIYITTDYTISDAFSTRFRMEADQSALTSNGKIGVLVKDAWLKWKDVFSGADLVAGMSPTPAFDVSEGAWSYRSLEKTIMDFFGIVPSRDLGIDLKGKFTSDGMASYWLKIGDGTGNSPESNKFKRYYGQLMFKPSPSLLITLYADMASNPQKRDSFDSTMKDNNAIVAAGFLNYKSGKDFSVGAEAFIKSQSNNYAKSGQALASQSGLGFSIWAWLALTDGIKLVGRYDMYDPNTDADAKFDKQSLIVGALDFAVGPKVSVMPGVEMHNYEKPDGATDWHNDLVPRITFFWEF
jgi:hypothetical protein